VELELWRYSGGVDATLGFLMLRGSTWEFLCHIVEDEYRAEKIMAETRIPAGRYEIKFRDEGRMASDYRHRYGPIHHGMLWLQDVPNFEWIYIHTGNDDDDSAGCLIVGEKAEQIGRSVSQSRVAYQRIYTRIAYAIEIEEGAWITIRDLDRLPAPT